MNASKLILTSALLALAAEGLTSTALSAQCTQTRQRNWNAQFAWDDDVAFKRSFVFVNPESYDIKVCDIGVKLANGGCSSATVRMEVRRDNNGGAPNSGGLIVRSGPVSIPDSVGTVRATFSNLILAAGERYQIVLDYGTSNGCGLFGNNYIKKPTAPSGNTIESYFFTEQSGVQFWLRDDQPVRYQVNYRPNVRGISQPFGASCGASAPCSSSAFREINFNGNPMTGQLQSNVRRAFRVRDTFGYPTRDVCSVEFRSASGGASPVDLVVALYDESGTLPGQVLAQTTVSVPPGVPQVVRASFPNPARINAGTNYWVSLETLNGGSVVRPIERFGNPIDDAVWDGSAWTAGNGNSAYAFRTFVTSGPATRPTLSATAPLLGADQTMRLRTAGANARAVLLIGVSNPDIDLGPLGAPGCRALSSGDIALDATATGAGSADVRYTVPNDRSLLGAEFYGQFAVLSGSNSLGLLFTNGTRNVVGTF